MQTVKAVREGGRGGGGGGGPSARGGAVRAACGPNLARRAWRLAVPRRGTPRKKWPALLGCRGLLGPPDWVWVRKNAPRGNGR